MRIVICLLSLLLALPASAAEWLGQLPDTDQQAIEATAADADAHWNARDAQAMASMYTDEATLVVGGGAAIQGPAAVLDYFTQSFARTPAAMRHTTVVDRLVVLAPDLVLADTRVTLDRTERDGGAVRVRDFNTLTVLARRDGAWKFVSVRAYPVAATL